MPPIHATFDVPNHVALSGDAIEAWFAVHHSRPIDSDGLREHLATSITLLDFNENSDVGRYVVALDDTTIAATAALADQAGLISAVTKSQFYQSCCGMAMKASMANSP